MWTSRFLLSGVLLLLGNASADGQTLSSIPDCKQDAACQPLSQRAVERFGAEDFAEALRLFKLAYEVRADPRLLYNMARTLHKQGQLAAATTYYQQFLNSAVQDDAQRQKAHDYLSQISPTPPIPPPSSSPEDIASQQPERTTDLGQRTGQPSSVERHRPPRTNAAHLREILVAEQFPEIMRDQVFSENASTGTITGSSIAFSASELIFQPVTVGKSLSDWHCA